jgi:two-component system KDP operon response regulator KdpE
VPESTTLNILPVHANTCACEGTLVKRALVVSLTGYRPFRDAFAPESAKMTHLLIVEAETPSRTELVEALKSRGHRVTAIEDSYALPAALAVHRPEIALLELLLNPEVNSLELCERLRSWSSIPVIFTSVYDSEPIIVRALDAGADDILIKPFGVDELLARVRAIQRRLVSRPGNASPQVRVGDLTIDLAARLVLLRDVAIHLTRKEYDLLRVLALAQGGLVSYERLLTEIWGGHKGVKERTSVRTLVKQVRRKLGENPQDPTYVLTEAGLGCRLNMSTPQ